MQLQEKLEVEADLITVRSRLRSIMAWLDYRFEEHDGRLRFSRGHRGHSWLTTQPRLWPCTLTATLETNGNKVAVGLSFRLDAKGQRLGRHDHAFFTGEMQDVVAWVERLQMPSADRQRQSEWVGRFSLHSTLGLVAVSLAPLGTVAAIQFMGHQVPFPITLACYLFCTVVPLVAMAFAPLLPIRLPDIPLGSSRPMPPLEVPRSPEFSVPSGS